MNGNNSGSFLLTLLVLGIVLNIYMYFKNRRDSKKYRQWLKEQELIERRRQGWVPGPMPDSLAPLRHVGGFAESLSRNVPEKNEGDDYNGKVQH